jgi:ribosomal protein L19
MKLSESVQVQREFEVYMNAVDTITLVKNGGKRRTYKEYTS